MDFVDWCGTVLGKLVELGKTSPAAQSYGIGEDALLVVLLGADAEAELEARLSPMFQALPNALRELRKNGLVKELGDGSHLWEVTESGRRYVTNRRALWRDICVLDVDFPPQKQLLEVLNELSQRTGDDGAWLELIDSGELAARLEWATDRAQFRAAVQRLIDLDFADGMLASQAADLHATLRGLIWATRCVKSKIFVSYRRAPSEPYALLIAEKLSPYGMDVFVDTLTVDGAEPFPERLERGIAECDVFVALLAPATLDSDWVRREVKLADELGKPMIPAFQPDFVPPADAPDYIQKLLIYEGVKLNPGYVPEAIEKLARLVEETWFKRFR
ncbi:MAG TPA: toll/interleukin-1 receptor domain-containing protein [Aggregatilineales bacterium]|nr:toll/interleukin-1 receptor domain-containing protein [Aggregatilineales bacterium]